VLHCPTDTGRNAWTLAQAEKELGLQSTVLVYHSTWLGYPNDIDLRTRERSPAGKAWAIGRLLLKAARDYDVVHFNGGRSLMPGSPGLHVWLSTTDLRYLRALGKGLVVTFQGCDTRRAGYCTEHYEICACAAECVTRCPPALDRHKARLAHGFDRYADAIFSLNPDLLWVLPARARFLPYTTIDLREWRALPPRKPSDAGPFVILHAPTNRGVKGTRLIVEAVEAVSREYPQVELLLVENMPSAEVRACYERADLVIDQVLLGWYGGLAVEAMALGKPVVCYLRDEDLKFIPEQMRRELPIINTLPGDLLGTLRSILEGRLDLTEVSRRGRAYVEHWHDPLTVAARMKATYERILAGKKKAR
jgi:hypothetical protein